MWDSFSLIISTMTIREDGPATDDDVDASMLFYEEHDCVLIDTPNLKMARNVHNARVFYFYVRKES